MPRLTAPSLKRVRGAILLTALLAATLLAPQVAAAYEGGGEDTAPIIASTKLTPASLPYDGGTFTIEATIEDDYGVFMAYAQVYGPSNFESVMLIPSAVSPAGVVTYAAQYDVPPNYTDSPVGYGVEIQATDTNGAFVTELAGEVQVDAQPQFDEAPYLSDWSVTPEELPAAGGPVTIKTSASDNRGISYAYALVTPNSGGPGTEVPLEPVSSNQFEGVFDVPVNHDALGKGYSVKVFAQDDIGQEASADAGSFFVAGARPGKLIAWTSNGSFFGIVDVWTHATRQVVVSNVRGEKTAPVNAVMTTTGPPFFLPGKPAGIHFTLGPGQRRTFDVEFRPRTPGFWTGGVVLDFPSESQPKFAVTLSGRGYKPPPLP
jgi:hypothetical protein